jgi:glycosyltransferase involved in cell wall biosynthesis
MQISQSNYPLVSVIVNCYNGETYLRDSIKSILDQSYKNFEIIFWDNQSKDQSASIYKSFNDKRLKYYYSKKYTSLYEARNLAIKKSKGKYIAFLDTDDLWVKNKLILQIKKLENEKVSLVYSNYYILNQLTGLKKKFYKKILPEGIIYKKLLKNYFIGICTVVIKKDFFLKKKNLFNKRYNIIGDFDLFTRISKKNYFASIQEPLSIYRIHNNSFSNQNYLMHINELKLWLKNQVIFNDDSLLFIKEKIIYMEAILNLLNRKYILAINKINKIESFTKKFKLLFFLLMPNFIFTKLKNNF